MSAPMKKHPIKKAAILLRMVYKGRTYEIPKTVVEKYEVNHKELDEEKSVPAEEVFTEINAKYTKAGALLKGVRYREDLTQIEFAKKLGITQADLSKMENGKRPIGKNMAKRIGKMFDTDYRYFLE